MSGNLDVISKGDFIVHPFLDNQLEVMSKAKAIITRGGASTLVECEVLSKKTIVRIKNKLKRIVVVLKLFLIVLAVYTVKLCNNNKDTITIL